MTSLVESTMLYGAEIWGCNRNMEGVEQTRSVESLENVLWCRNTTSQSFSASRDGGPTSEMGDVCCSGSGYCHMMHMMVV